MARSSSSKRIGDEDREQPDWEGRLQETIAKLRPAVASSLSEEGLEFLEHQLARVVRFGSGRKGPIVSMLAHVGNYWRGLILLMLRAGSLRTSELRAMINVGIPSTPLSQRMLTLNLRILERDGLIERETTGTAPTRVVYRLTQSGRTLSDFMFEIIEWSTSHFDDVVRARQNFDGCA